jgi:Histidine kinase-, DNA gyrase B-, and HSP90-like ATPase
MHHFMTTRLWRASLALQPTDSEDSPRARLSSLFLKFRERASLIAEEIARDLPEFTVHNVTHLDALWEMAALITGDQVTLTPAEAFVLGGAFLTHDLGMGLAAFPQGRRGLRQDANWNDLVTSALKKRLGRAPSVNERREMEGEVEVEVITELLRQRHAKQAAQLSLVSWTSSDGKTSYHLIEEPELRDAFGEAIGQIAFSHWWSIDQVRQRFGELPPLYPPAGLGFPGEWTVDRLKLACLLRTSDAIHLDSRRAPGFLRALRKPSGYADLHWTFQQHIHTPGIDGERIEFTSGYAFPVEEAPAWWVGYELLQTADRELRQVDTLLQDLNRPYRFAARGVAGVESPARLVRHIPTQDWVPIDARVQVSNVAALIQNLGGEQLYGKDDKVPLRELIQNASDAVRARRMLRNRPGTWGDIIVRLGKDETGDWIEVEDEGVGMSTAVLTGPFLDFGKSFWDTAMMREEWPRLQASGFQSSGKYGIGFFSAFMWGDRVRVTTRRLGDAERETQILEFSGGLQSRPILRKAREPEFINDGTKVRVWLREPPASSKGLLSRYGGRGGPWILKELCAWLCPCIDVNLYVEEENGRRELAVAAGDWITMDGVQLIKRVFFDSYLGFDEEGNSESKRRLLRAAKNFHLLKDVSGNVVGRASITRNVFNIRERTGVITTIGGLHNGEMNRIAGVLIGSSTRASRDIAIPIVESSELARWASEQAALILNTYSDPYEQANCAEVVRLCGGETGDLPIAFGATGWLSFNDISTRTDLPDEFLLIDDSLIVYRYSSDEVTLDRNVLAAPAIRNEIIRSADHPEEIKWPESRIVHSDELRQLKYNTLKVAIIEALAKGWGASLDEVVKCSSFSSGGQGRKYVIQRMVGNIESLADVIRNPARLAADPS